VVAVKELLRLPFVLVREIYRGVGMGIEICFPREHGAAERFAGATDGAVAS
jgi:hypothetical protein